MNILISRYIMLMPYQHAGSDLKFILNYVLFTLLLALCHVAQFVLAPKCWMEYFHLLSRLHSTHSRGCSSMLRTTFRKISEKTQEHKKYYLIWDKRNFFYCNEVFPFILCSTPPLSPSPNTRQSATIFLIMEEAQEDFGMTLRKSYCWTFHSANFK